MRQCGGCTLCCKLIPVEELGKPAGVRCPHVRWGKGCSIYARRPVSCREWSCLWLKGSEAGGDLDLSRPDRAGYVLDEVPDIVRIRNNETGEVTQIDVMQAWLDPARPTAVDDDSDLLAMLERQGIVLLVRFDSVRGYALFPPSRAADGQWHRSPTGSAEDLREAQLEARLEFWRHQIDQQERSEEHGNTETEIG